MSKSFPIDKQAILELAELLSETGLSEIEYEAAGSRIRVVKHSAAVATPIAVAATPPAPMPAAAPIAPHDLPGTVRSPMVGTVYLSAEPGSPPFVRVGDTVTAGQTLLIIEAMKVMNPLKSPQAGLITHIFVKDGSPVEYDEHLLVISS